MFRLDIGQPMIFREDGSLPSSELLALQTCENAEHSQIIKGSLNYLVKPTELIRG